MYQNNKPFPEFQALVVDIAISSHPYKCSIVGRHTIIGSVPSITKIWKFDKQAFHTGRKSAVGILSYYRDAAA